MGQGTAREGENAVETNVEDANKKDEGPSLLKKSKEKMHNLGVSTLYKTNGKDGSN